MLVCDTCGRPAAETVTFKTSRGNRQPDYCTQHLDELLGPSRAPKGAEVKTPESHPHLVPVSRAGELHITNDLYEGSSSCAGGRSTGSQARDPLQVGCQLSQYSS